MQRKRMGQCAVMRVVAAAASQSRQAQTRCVGYASGNGPYLPSGDAS